MEMTPLFETVATQERCCGTCVHSASRHGVHARGTYPLVCLLMACPVRYKQDGDFACRTDFDGVGRYPRGWEPR